MTDTFDKTREESRNIDGESKQFLTFNVGSDEYGIDIMRVREIKGWQETTRLPGSPEYMCGVMNLRGLIIPIFDLRARFSGEMLPGNSSQVIIVLAVENRNIGVLVDAVSDILTVNSSEIKPTPMIETEVDYSFITGLLSIDNRMVVVLDVNKLFQPDDYNESERADSNQISNQ